MTSCTVADLRGAPGVRPTAQNFLNFMQFLGKSGKFVCWRPLLWEILDPPLLQHRSTALCHLQHRSIIQPSTSTCNFENLYMFRSQLQILSRFFFSDIDIMIAPSYFRFYLNLTAPFSLLETVEGHRTRNHFILQHSVHTHFHTI